MENITCTSCWAATWMQTYLWTLLWTICYDTCLYTFGCILVSWATKEWLHPSFDLAAYRRSFLVSAYVIVVTSPLSLLVESFLFYPKNGRLYAYDSSIDGGRFRLLCEMLVYLFTYDAITYWVHRALHTIPWAYERWHRERHHYRSLDTFSLARCQPFDFVLLALLPLWTFPLLVGHTWKGWFMLFKVLSIVWNAHLHSPCIDCHGGDRDTKMLPRRRQVVVVVL